MAGGAARGSPGRAGFTLFEVLAAVAILGLLFAVLANIAIDAMRFEGEAERRLRASLLADRVLGDLERGFSLGAAPPVGTTETEEDEFSVVAEVRPFDLAGFAATLGGEEVPADPRSAAPPQTLLAVPSGGPPPLLEIEVVVGWIEGSTPLEIRRLTYGFDAAAAAPLLEGLAANLEQIENQEAEAGEGTALPPGGTLPGIGR